MTNSTTADTAERTASQQPKDRYMTQDEVASYLDYLHTRLPYAKAVHVLKFGAYPIIGYGQLEHWLSENTNLTPRDILRCLNHGAARVMRPTNTMETP